MIPEICSLFSLSFLFPLYLFCLFVFVLSVSACPQIKVHKHYSAKDFDKDLRSVLTRAGVKNERIAFIFDESNVLNTAFLERMNALLASGEVPGLFEGQDYTGLMQDCKETFRKVKENKNDDAHLRPGAGWPSVRRCAPVLPFAWLTVCCFL